jgi:hypothetical protein
MRGLVLGFSPKAKDILQSVGGVSIILPIFAQLKMSVRKGERAASEVDPDFQPVLIRVLISFLRDSSASQEEFSSSNDFSVIGH